MKRKDDVQINKSQYENVASNLLLNHELTTYFGSISPGTPKPVETRNHMVCIHTSPDQLALLKL